MIASDLIAVRYVSKLTAESLEFDPPDLTLDQKPTKRQFVFQSPEQLSSALSSRNMHRTRRFGFSTRTLRRLSDVAGRPSARSSALVRNSHSSSTRCTSSASNMAFIAALMARIREFQSRRLTASHRRGASASLVDRSTGSLDLPPMTTGRTRTRSS